jgi:hypothetical protein
LVGLSFEEIIALLYSGLTFRADVPGDHINWWTTDKASAFLAKAGLDAVPSAFGQSMFAPFKEVGPFDASHYWVATYIDAVHLDANVTGAQSNRYDHASIGS